MLTRSGDSPDSPGARSTVMAPGERRVIQMPLFDEADPLACRLIFARDHHNPNSFTAVIMSGSFRRSGVALAFQDAP